MVDERVGVCVAIFYLAGGSDVLKLVEKKATLSRDSSGSSARGDKKERPYRAERSLGPESIIFYEAPGVNRAIVLAESTRLC